MKKIFKTSVASLCLLFATSCANEELIENSNLQSEGNFTIEIGLGTDSRASYYYDSNEEEYKIKWQEGDKVYVSSEDGEIFGTLKLIEGANSTSGKFSGMVIGNKKKLNYVVYPVPDKATKKIDLTTRDAEFHNPPMIATLGDDKTKADFEAPLPAILLKIKGLTADTKTLIVEGEGIGGKGTVVKGNDGYELSFDERKNKITITGISSETYQLFIPIIADTDLDSNEIDEIELKLEVGNATYEKNVRFFQNNVTDSPANGFLELTYHADTNELTEAWNGEASDDNIDFTQEVVEIHDAAGLKAFADYVKEGNAMKQQTVKLMNDVDLNGQAWTPIGEYGVGNTYFKGTFDGNGKTVSNLNVTNDHAGLFGVLLGATVKNLTLENAVVTGTNAGGVTGSCQSENMLENVKMVNCKVNGEEGSEELVGKYEGNAYAVVDGVTKAKIVNDNHLKMLLTLDHELIDIRLEVNAKIDISAWDGEENPNVFGGESTKSIAIDLNEKKLTFNQLNSDWNNVAARDAKMIIKNGKITNSGHNGGPWNRHDINFACPVELVNVISDKAIALKNAGTLTNVTIDDDNTSDTYAIWIQPIGQTVTLDGCIIDMLGCTDGRGIKIDNQYLDSNEEEKVTLNVSNTTFKTEEKAAIIVKTTKGADINLMNIDIDEVADDNVCEVWVDEDASGTYDLVKVNGGSKMIEGYAAGVAITQEGNYELSTAEAMFWFANEVNVNKNAFSGKTIKLVADIDLKNQIWEPIGQTGKTEFKGIFDGQNNIIKNLNVDKTAATDEHTSSGLFGWAESGVTIKNVKIDGAKVKGNHNVAVIVGYTYSGKISDCHVTNAEIVCTHANDDACGDKCGLIAGYAGDESRFTNCSASNSTVKAGRDAGQLIGGGYNVSVSGCSATNVTVTANGDCNGNNINEALIGRVLG